MLHLAAEGWVCVAINYRLSPKATWPEHLIDCKRALAWVREHIAEYGGDPDLICVTGGSAGGHLAAMVGAHRERAAVPARASRPRTPRSPRAFPSTASTTSSTCSQGRARATGPCALLANWVMKTTTEENRARVRGRVADPPRPRRRAAVLRDPRQPRQPGAGRPGPPLRRAAPRQVSDEPVLYAEVPGASHAFDVFYSTRTGARGQRGRPLPRVGRRPATGPRRRTVSPRTSASPRRWSRSRAESSSEAARRARPARGRHRRPAVSAQRSLAADDATLNGIDRSEDQGA